MKKTVCAQELKGILPWRGKPVSIEEMNRAVAEARARKWERFLKSADQEGTNDSQDKMSESPAVKSK